MLLIKSLELISQSNDDEALRAHYSKMETIKANDILQKYVTYVRTSPNESQRRDTLRSLWIGELKNYSKASSSLV